MFLDCDSFWCVVMIPVLIWGITPLALVLAVYGVLLGGRLTLYIWRRLDIRETMQALYETLESNTRLIEKLGGGYRDEKEANIRLKEENARLRERVVTLERLSHSTETQVEMLRSENRRVQRDLDKHVESVKHRANMYRQARGIKKVVSGIIGLPRTADGKIPVDSGDDSEASTQYEVISASNASFISPDYETMQLNQAGASGPAFSGSNPLDVDLGMPRGALQLKDLSPVLPESHSEDSGVNKNDSQVKLE